MKKILKILLYIVLAILVFIGLLIALFLYAQYSSRKELAEKKSQILEECNKETYITQPLGVDILHFNNSDIDTLTFEVVRNNMVVKDTTITGTTYGKHILTVSIPFEKFKTSDTIVIITSNGLKFNISNFNRNVKELYGMFGPVALSDCYVIKNYIINGEKDTYQINKFYGYLDTDGDSIQRISTAHPDFEKLTASYPITKEKVDSIGRKIYSNYHRAGIGSNIGLEITPQKSYYIKGFLIEDQFEIIKIDTQTGAQSKRLTNYPIDNEF